MRRTPFCLLVVAVLLAVAGSALAYPTAAQVQGMQQMINRGNPQRAAYEQARKRFAETARAWDNAGRPATGPIIDQAIDRMNAMNAAESTLKANRDSVIHVVDSLYDTGIPAGADIAYDPDCKGEGYNTSKCAIRLCEGTFTDPDWVASTKIHEWCHQQQKAAGRWGPGNVPPDTSFERAQLESEAYNAELTADFGNKTKLSIDQKLDLLKRKLAEIKHMLEALKAEIEGKKDAGLPGGTVHKMVTVINHSDTIETVNVSVEPTLAWLVTPSNFTVVLDPGQEQMVEVAVAIPPLEPVGSVCELFCYAAGAGAPDTTVDFAFVYVTPTVWVTPPEDTAGSRGEIVALEYTVANVGIDLDLVHYDFTNPLGWPILPPGGDVLLLPDEQVAVTCSVSVDPVAPSWTTNLIECSAYSLFYPGNEHQDWAMFEVKEIDVAAGAIEEPDPFEPLGEYFVPELYVYNSGKSEGTTYVGLVMAWPESTDATYVDSVLGVHLLPGEETRVSFAPFLPPVAATYDIMFYTAAPGDADPSNDTVYGSFVVASAVTSGWREVEPMPAQPSLKDVKRGGWLAYEGSGDIIYAAKGYKTNDFYAYNFEAGTWTQLNGMPYMRHPLWYKKAPRKGSRGVSDQGNNIYVTQGNNSLGFWRYLVGQDSWEILDDVPLGPYNKKVKGGTDLAYVHDGPDRFIYLLKGYKTEFYRFNVGGDSWESLPDAPTGGRAKWDKGSWLVPEHSGGDWYIYAHKAKYHELYRYHVEGDSWGPMLQGMPFTGMSGRRKKSKDGGCAVLYDDRIYALKGGNTGEFWLYDPSIPAWTELDSVPSYGSTGKKKRVKHGGHMVGIGGGVFYALKGNKTRELWRYAIPTAFAVDRRPERNGVMALPAEARWVGVSVAPNPVTRGVVSLRYGLRAPGSADIVVHDVLGRTVYRRRLAPQRSGNISIDLRELSAGVYLLRFDAVGMNETRKLIIQR